MAVTEIPLSPDNQTFSITLAGTEYQIRALWRGAFWIIDLMDGTGALIISGIPLVTGADLLAQYAYLNLGFSLYVVCDDPQNDYPTKADLGIRSHLYVESGE